MSGLGVPLGSGNWGGGEMSPLYHGDTKLELVAGKTIFDYADNLKVRVPTSCSRSGECHECIVEVKRGMEALSPLTDPEAFLRGNYRLACQATVIDPEVDVEFGVLRRQPRILTDSVRREVELQPLTVREGRRRLFQGRAHRRLPRRSIRYRHRRWHDHRRAQIWSISRAAKSRTRLRSRTRSASAAATSCTASLTMAASSRASSSRSCCPPSTLRSGTCLASSESHRRRIYEVVIVGNATMRDILFGFDVQPIGERPYKSVTELEMLGGERGTTSLNVKASELGLRVFPKAQRLRRPTRRKPCRRGRGSGPAGRLAWTRKTTW